MTTDLISDLLTRVRNAQRAGHSSAHVVASNMSQRILEVLRDEGYIASFSPVASDSSGGGSFFDVSLKYTGSGKPVIRRANRVSRPGRRVYSKVDQIPRVESGLGIAIVSTSQGVITDREARKRQIGGEVLAVVS